MRMHDSEVVAAIVAGDPDGLAEAYDRYAAPLYTYCRSLLREPADAADAVQDTFVIAASKLAGLRDQSRLRPWLYAVARNECRRRLRENASTGTSALDQVPEMSDESADVTGGAERAELRALLRSAVRGLNTSEQDLIQLQLQQELDAPSPSAGGTTPAGGGPSSSPSAPSPSHSPGPSHSPSPRHSPSPSSPAPSASSTTPIPPSAPGTLRATPRTIVVSALSGASVTLTASGGPVSWSVTESSGLVGKLSVAPSSGRLLAGQSTTVSVNVSGGLLGLASSRVRAVPGTGGVCVGCQLIINPGGIVVSVIVEVDISPSSPPPSSGSPGPEVGTGRPAVRLVN